MTRWVRVFNSFKSFWIAFFLMAHRVRIFNYFNSFFIILFLSGVLCTQTGCNRNRCLDNIKGLSFGSGRLFRVSVIRGTSVRDTALSLGARAGLACRAEEINCILLKYESELHRLFNFRAMLLDKNVLPPVLVEGRNTLNLAGPDIIRIASRTYHILCQAHFVTAPPIWRDYLWMNYGSPETPDRSLLPRTSEEKVVWKTYTEQGFAAGTRQADLIFTENLAKLKRDYEGMIRYRTLLAQNMISPPYVAEMDLGVTGCPNDMNVGDKILRITAFPELRCDSRDWRTEIIPYE